MEDIIDRMKAVSSTLDGKPRCVALTKVISGRNAGKEMGPQCKRSALEGGLFCKTHQGRSIA